MSYQWTLSWNVNIGGWSLWAKQLLFVLIFFWQTVWKKSLLFQKCTGIWNAGMNNFLLRTKWVSCIKWGKEYAMWCQKNKICDARTAILCILDSINNSKTPGNLHVCGVQGLLQKERRTNNSHEPLFLASLDKQSRAAAQKKKSCAPHECLNNHNYGNQLNTNLKAEGEKIEVGVEGGQRREGERKEGGQEQEWGGNRKTQIYQIIPLFPLKRWETEALQGLAQDMAFLSEHDAGPIALLFLNWQELKVGHFRCRSQQVCLWHHTTGLEPNKPWILCIWPSAFAFVCQHSWWVANELGTQVGIYCSITSLCC